MLDFGLGCRIALSAGRFSWRLVSASAAILSMKLLPRLAAAALVLAAIAGGICWQQQRSAAQRRLEAWELQRVEEAIPLAWDQSFAWEKADLKLADFADLIAEKSGLVVELDEAGIAATRSWQVQPRDLPIHVPPGEYPLQALLRMALTADGLCADLRGQKVVITAQASSTDRTRLHTVVYPLPQPDPEGLDEEAWRRLISGVVEGHVEAVPGALIVVENAVGHRRVRATIDAICHLGKPTPEPIEIPPVDVANHERLLAALAQRTSLDPVETPLNFIVSHLVDRHRVPLLLDVRRINAAGVSLDTPITKSFRNISLQSALRMLLGELELTFALRDGAIVITTPEHAESQPRIIAYPVDDLFDPSAGDGLTDLTGLLRLMIAPHSWDSPSGLGMIKVVNEKWLIVQQTSYVQAELTAVLQLLRQALASQHFEVLPARSAEPQQKIRAALERNIELSLSGQPLTDVILMLRDQLGIPIMLKTKTLDEAGVNIEAPVNVPLPSGRAGLYLDLSLDLLELVAVIRDEVLLITTAEDAESQLDTRLYDTRALINEAFSTDDLRELISGVIHPQMWDHVGGVGSASFFRDILVVGQTREVHRDLERLLAALTQHCTDAGDSGVERPWIVPVDARPEQLQLETLLDKVIAVQIEKDHGFNVIVGRAEIKDAGYSLPLPPESLTASGISLGGALRKLLAPQRLDYVARENVLYVTTEQSAAARFETRMYRISDLVPGRWPSAAEFESAMQAAAVGSADTKTSMELGNTATIEPEWLVLRGSQRLHRWIADWLADLRTSK
jgi:hypothetical protein